MVTNIIKFPPKSLFQQEIVEKGYLFLTKHRYCSLHFILQ